MLYLFQSQTTLISQIEAMLNSRPLTPLLDDPLELNGTFPDWHFNGDGSGNDRLHVSNNRL